MYMPGVYVFLFVIISFFFITQLGRAPDGFSVVADYFGRGVFSDVRRTLHVQCSLYNKDTFIMGTPL